MSALEDGRWLVVLTQSERIALIDLIVEFLLAPNSTNAFIDVVQNKETTPGDLIRVIDKARWFPEFPSPKRNSENPRAAHG